MVHLDRIGWERARASAPVALSTSVPRRAGAGTCGAWRTKPAWSTLRREDADDGHVVGVRELPFFGARPALLPEQRDGVRIEDPRLADRPLAHRLLDPRRRVGTDERQRVRRAVRLLLAPQDRFGDEPARGPLEHVLLVEDAELVRGRQRRGELDDVRVEEREATLDGARHEHPVALRGQDVAGEQSPHLEVLVLRERRPARDLRREGRDEARGRVVSLERAPEIGGEEPLEGGRARPPQRVGEARLRRPVEIPPEEPARHGPLRGGRAREVRVEALDQERPDRRARMPRPEAAHLGLAEQVVSGEHLVRALARQHDLDAGGADEPREQQHRRRRRPQDRPLRVRDDEREHLRHVAARDDDLRVLAAEEARHLALPACLVVLGVLEAQGEGAEARARRAEPERGDDRAVEASGEVAADRHVRAQHAQARRPLERRAQRLGGVLERAAEGEAVALLGEARRPVAALLPRAVAVAPHVAGAELFDAAEHGLRRDDGPERERLVESPRIEGARQRRRRGEDRLHLAREEHAPVVLGHVERAHAHAVAAEHELAAPRVPERDRPLAVEALERPFAPLLPRVDDDLGVAPRPEAVAALLELRAQVEVVEDLAVVGDPERAVLVREGLLPGREVDDREPRVRQADPVVAVDAELVRAAVSERGGHGAERLDGGGGAASRQNAADATHVRSALPARRARPRDRSSVSVCQ
jgi:hypothetical protein